MAQGNAFPRANTQPNPRAGQFRIDNSGYLINSGNERLQGYLTDSSNNITSNVGDIQISSTPVSPRSSANINLAMNLDANETVPAAFSAANPTATSNFSAGVTVYDSLGNSHLVTIYFRKSAANSWQWNALVDGGEITGGTAGVNEVEANGTLTFNTSGALTNATTTASDFDFLGAAQNQTIAFNFGSTTTTGTGLDGATQFGSDSAINNLTQDGYASGSLKSVTVSANGTVSGNYTNGTTRTISQIVLARFQSESGLRRMGGNDFVETLESGAALIAAPGTGGLGSVLSATLEQSNVDVANELIKMMIIQRGFQANSRTIGAVNDMLAQLVNLGQ